MPNKQSGWTWRSAEGQHGCWIRDGGWIAVRWVRDDGSSYYTLLAPPDRVLPVVCQGEWRFITGLAARLERWLRHTGDA